MREQLKILNSLIGEKNKDMDKISQDITDLESSLKKSSFSDFGFEAIPGSFNLLWDSYGRRLCVVFVQDNMCKPLIETKAHVRVLLHEFLDKFVDKLIQRQKEEKNELFRK